MSAEERCAQCGAAMMADAPWCTLCLTPRTVREPAVPLAAAVAATNASLYAPVAREEAAAEVGHTWPCHSCGQDVAIAADLCPKCGAAFLGGPEAMPTLNLPIVGDVTQRSKPAMYGIAAAIGLGIAMLVISALALIGSIF